MREVNRREKDRNSKDSVLVRCPDEIMRLTGENHEQHRVTECVLDHDDLAGQTAPGTPDPLSARFLFCSRSLRMRLHDTTVNEYVFEVKRLE